MGQRLLDGGVSPRSISAGFAWDAWHCYRYTLDHPYDIATLHGDIPWWIEEMLPSINPEYVVSNSPAITGFEHLQYFHSDRYNVVSSADYFSFFYGREMKMYTLRRVPGVNRQPEGTVAFDFLNNLPGARTRGPSPSDALKPFPAHIGGVEKSAWRQMSPSSMTFRMQLPYGRCRLKASLGMSPSAQEMAGDGALCRILVDDVLVENVFTEIAAVRVAELRQFFRPRTFFFKKPRPYFVQYIDPKQNPAARAWQDISLDLSAFAGKVVDIIFEVSGGPANNDRDDEVLWADPFIESY
jgi:hypothetical protein